MTREEFITKWRFTVAGMALFGTISERLDGPTKRAAVMMEIPGVVEKLLGAMFDGLMRDSPVSSTVTPVTVQPRKAG